MTVQVLTLMKKKQENVCVVVNVYEFTIVNKKFSSNKIKNIYSYSIESLTDPHKRKNLRVI